MATNIIDTNIKGATFPPTYTGLGTIAASARTYGDNARQVTSGFFTSNGNATQINCGFRPLKIRLLNVTDTILWDWMYGMGATQSLKTVTAGTVTIDTTSTFTVTGQNAGNFNVTLSVAANGTGKLLLYEIEG